MKYSVSECGEGSNPEANTLEYLGFVVAALGEAVGIGNIKAVEYVLIPVSYSGDTGFKFRDMAVFCMKQP